MPIKKSRGVGVLVSTLLAVAAMPSAASAAAFESGACVTPALSQPFIGLGDENRYFMAPGGDFEVRGVWSTNGDAEYRSGARSDAWGGSTVLSLDGASTTSPTICVDDTYPHLRLAAKAEGSTSLLLVEAILDGGTRVPLSTLTGANHGSWSYSGFVPLAPAVGLSLGQKTELRLRVKAIGDWRVDAVSIDPRTGG